MVPGLFASIPALSKQSSGVIVAIPAANWNSKFMHYGKMVSKDQKRN
jgi:hypothetical protein